MESVVNALALPPRNLLWLFSCRPSSEARDESMQGLWDYWPVPFFDSDMQHGDHALLESRAEMARCLVKSLTPCEMEGRTAMPTPQEACNGSPCGLPREELRGLTRRILCGCLRCVRSMPSAAKPEHGAVKLYAVRVCDAPPTPFFKHALILNPESDFISHLAGLSKRQ
jgi:hypothetical protein